MSHISIIVAVGSNGEIGFDNELLWDIPDDLKWFKKNTVGRNVVMGRRTFESIGHPLKDRHSIVLTRSEGFAKLHDGITVCTDIDSLMDNYSDIVVIGGGDVYRQFMPFADKLYLTKVYRKYYADTHFPNVDWKEWSQVLYEKKANDDGLEYSFNIYNRVK